MPDTNLWDQNKLGKRADPLKLALDIKYFEENKILHQLADAVSNMLVILNPERQIVFANKQFLQFLQVDSGNAVYGKRPGEAVNCMYSGLEEGGCGTSEFCRTCGALGAVLESQIGRQAVRECRIMTCHSDALDLRITATPYNENGPGYTIFAIQDISHEKRRQTLERVFFHDVLNSAGGIFGLSAMLLENPDLDEASEITSTIHRAAKNMINEIQSQQLLTSAERGDLVPDHSNTNSLRMLKDLADLYQGYELSKHKNITIDPFTEDLTVSTDPMILRRVLGNMLKNALEASVNGSRVEISCKTTNEGVVFSVHNDSFIDIITRNQIFQRSFSTKGTGRGLGTYSMKLLGEKYLGGKVWFTTHPDNGTTFFIRLPERQSGN